MSSGVATELRRLLRTRRERARRNWTAHPRRDAAPAYDPEPDAYVTWDYCRGYADASLNEATSDPDGYR